MKDGEIITRIQQGERELLNILIERYYDHIYRFCFYKTGNRESAQDCAQETFLRMIRYIDVYVEKVRFKAYLFQIACSACSDSLRRRGDDVLEEEAVREKIDRLSDERESRFVEKVETAELVKAALKQLPESQRDAIILRFYSDMKLREIARITGVSLPTAKARLKRGKENLKEILEKEELL